MARVRELQSSVHARLQPVKIVRDRLRTDQQMLDAELQGAEDLLNSIMESMMKHKEAVMSRLNARNEDAMQKLREFAVLQEYESSMAAAESTNDMRGVFDLASHMELECNDLEESVTDGDNSGRIVLGDVTGGLRDLQVSISRQVKRVLQLCDSADSCDLPNSVCSLQRKVENLGGSPVWVTSCTNTVGYVSDESGRVIKLETTETDKKFLPKLCFFVSKETSKNDHILLLSADGATRLKCYCAIDWSMFVSGLYCDSNFQLLYVLQQRSVTVTDLSGSVTRVIDASSLQGHSVGSLCGIDANGDKAFFFDQQERKIFGVDKVDGKLQTVINVEAFYETRRKVHESLSVLGSRIYLTDFAKGRVHNVCSISGLLKSSYPTRHSMQNTFNYPSDVTVASNGLMFVCEYKERVVRVLTSDGSILQTLGGGEEGAGDGFRGPHCAAALLTDEEQVLAVADRDGNCLSLFKILAPNAS